MYSKGIGNTVMKRKVIDGHMHLARWEGNDGRNVFEELLEYEERSGISAVDNMCSTNNGDLWDGFEADQSILGAIAKLENPTVFTHGCLYLPKDYTDFKGFDFKDQLDELMGIGLDGIKICDFKPDAYKLFKVDKHLYEYDDFIGYCEKNSVHMCWHVADPKDFWDPDNASEVSKAKGWFYGDGTYPSYETLMDMTYNFLDEHPKLNVLLAHMFFKSFDPDEMVALLEKYPNVCIDMAPGWEMFSGFFAYHDKWEQIFKKYSTRFLYATDRTIPGDIDYLCASAHHVLRFLETDDEFDVNYGHRTKGIRLEGDELDNVLYKNHERTVGQRPREIDKTALKKYIQKYLPLLEDSRNKQFAEEYYRKNLI